MTIETYGDGHFSWTDLATTDLDAAATFYSGLFGWDVEHRPITDHGVYLMFSIDGKIVAGAGQTDASIPPHWASYVNVENLDASLARAVEAGGTIVSPAIEVMEEGRMSVIADPEGAMLGLWEAGRHRGAEWVNAPGALVWNELSTRDVIQAKLFYGHIFPWSFDDSDMGDGTMYTSVRIPEGYNADGYNAGMFHMDESLGAIPPHWMVYFQVTSADAITESARALGAAIHKPPFDTPGGRMAVLADPQGAVFMVMESPSES